MPRAQKKKTPVYKKRDGPVVKDFMLKMYRIKVADKQKNIVFHTAIVLPDYHNPTKPKPGGIVYYEDGRVDNNIPEKTVREWTDYGISDEDATWGPQLQQAINELFELGSTINMSEEKTNKIIDIFEKWNLNECKTTKKEKINKIEDEKYSTTALKNQQISDRAVNAYKIDIDMDIVFKDICVRNDTDPYDQKQQLQFYISYTQTYILDIMHDFSENYKICKWWIEHYVSSIKTILNDIYPGRKKEINNDLKIFIAIEIFGLEEKEYRCTIYKSKIQELPDIYKILYIFTNFDSGNKMSTDQLNLQSIMEAILRTFGIYLEPINKDSNVLHMLINGSTQEVPQQYVILQDVVPKRGKSVMLRYFIKDKQQFSTQYLSIAHNFDAASETTSLLANIQTSENYGDVHVSETFTINDKVYTIIDYKLSSYLVQNNIKVKLNVNKVFNEDIKILWGHPKLYDEPSITNVSKACSGGNNTYAICKTIGDKAKRDYLYHSYMIGDKNNTLYIFSSNDILSAMVATIFLPSTIITGSSVGKDTTSSSSVFDNVEFIGSRKNLVRRDTEIIHKIDEEVDDILRAGITANESAQDLELLKLQVEELEDMTDKKFKDRLKDVMEGLNTRRRDGTKIVMKTLGEIKNYIPSGDIISSGLYSRLSYPLNNLGKGGIYLYEQTKRGFNSYYWYRKRINSLNNEYNSLKQLYLNNYEYITNPIHLGNRHNVDNIIYLLQILINILKFFIENVKKDKYPKNIKKEIENNFHETNLENSYNETMNGKLTSTLTGEIMNFSINIDNLKVSKNDFGRRRSRNKLDEDIRYLKKL